ncbi:MAG: 3-oxoacid CoA-transferase subunit B [Deltaproteobacteria bacterium]|nr:3-oxoacid CoA-transferase subunit B [Deltaproteobacteria bacterium]
MKEKEKLDRQTMALRVAKEFQDGDVVNLGLGIPVLASNFVPSGREVIFQSENGVLGFGEITLPGVGDNDLINAGGQTVHPQPGMSFFGQAESFCMIRGGHIDVSVMGAFQVSEKGDLANWAMPDKELTIGGSMDLAMGTGRLIAVMEHSTKEGQYRILKKCSYPITALESVNLIVTDIAVIEVTDQGLVLKEFAPGWTPEEVQSLTEPQLIVDPDCQEITLI